MVIQGSIIANEILLKLKVLPRPQKFFGAMLVGKDTASENFLNQKEKVAKELGIEFRRYRVPEHIGTDALRHEIARLATPKNCGGFIVQLPLPAPVNKHYVLNAIPKEKDVDFLGEAALGAFYTGRHSCVPPSVGVVAALIHSRFGNVSLRDEKAVVIGAGFLIGKPVGFWLQSRVGELVVLDSSITNLPGRLGDADIVISGAGAPHVFGASHLKKGVLVIDFGFTRRMGKIVGDFNPEGAEERAIAYTKTPGGTGPILVAKLYENFYMMNS